MSTTRATPEQPDTFAFTAQNEERVRAIIARYPEGRQASAIMPLLDLAQRQSGGWLPQAAIEYVAGMIDMPLIQAMEVATFYTMYNLAPVGEHLVQVQEIARCRTGRDNGRRQVHFARGRMSWRLRQRTDSSDQR